MSDFVNSAMNGKIDEVKLMLATEDISQEEAIEALNDSAEYGYPEVVRAILDDKRFDISDTTALTNASTTGNAEIVEMLLKDGRIDPMKNFDAIIYAAQKGHLSVIKLFMADPRVNPAWVPPPRPAARPPRPLVDDAFAHKHMNVVEELAKDPRVFNSLTKNNQSYAYVKKYLKSQHDSIIGGAMAFRDLELSSAPYRIPPYVLAQILSENVKAYNLHDIVTSITPILQPTMEGEDGRIKRPPQKLKRRKVD